MVIWMLCRSWPPVQGTPPYLRKIRQEKLQLEQTGGAATEWQPRDPDDSAPVLQPVAQEMQRPVERPPRVGTWPKGKTWPDQPTFVHANRSLESGAPVERVAVMILGTTKGNFHQSVGFSDEPHAPRIWENIAAFVVDAAAEDPSLVDAFLCIDA